MNLWIFSTHKDLSLSRLVSEAKSLSVSCEVVYFESLEVISNTLHSQQKKLFIKPDDKILIRWPFDADDTSVEYNIFVSVLLLNYSDQVSLDRSCLRMFTPYYEDKLFQSAVFEHLSVPSPQTYSLQSFEEVPSSVIFPCVLKKRVSSRSKNNFLISTISELRSKLSNKSVADYIIQEKIDIEDDVRVVVLGQSIIGAVKRHTHVREGNRISVKGREKYGNMSDEIRKNILSITKFLGADFVGFDILFDKKGNYYFIEANLSPQFDKFEETLDVNLAKMVIQQACL